MRARPNRRRLGAALAAAAVLSGTGPAAPGRGETVTAPAPNVVPLTMRTPHAGFDRLVVSVTVCEPGTGRCARVDDVMVDTGSTGLRLEGSAVPPWLHLPPLLGADRRPLAECLRFVHDTAWGPLRRVDLRMGGLVAADLPVQVVADGGEPQPTACPRSEGRATSNGTLGVGPQLFDCPDPCRQDATRPGVFAREAGRWAPMRGDVARADRLPNPASRFPGHDDGLVFDLPSPPGGAATEVTGTLRFGLDPAAGGLDAARLIGLDGAGRFTTLYGGTAYPRSLIDSGTETYILADDRLPRCEGLPWAFCAKPDRPLRATMVGRDGTPVPVSFAVGDYRTMRDRNVGASDRYAVAAEPSSDAFVWGAPLFLGRRIAVVLEGKRAPGQTSILGPAYAVE